MFTSPTAAVRDEGRSRAFTLIELIVAVLVGIAAVGYTSVINHSHNTKAEISLRQLHKTAMAAAAAQQRPVTLQDFQDAAPEVPSLSALGWSGASLAAGAADVQKDGDKPVSAGVVLVSIDPTNPNLVGLATQSTTGACVTLSGVALNATTKVGTVDASCTGAAALATAEAQAQLPTPSGTTGTPTTSPTTTSPTSTPTTTTATTSATASATTTTPAPEPTHAPSQMAYSTPATALGNQGWVSIAYGAGQYVAVGNKVAATSPDGATWTVRPLPTPSGPATKVAYGNGRYLVGYGTGEIYWSIDGVNWTAGGRPGDKISNLEYLGGVFVASGDGARYHISTSTDGVTWAGMSPSAYIAAGACLTYGNGTYLFTPKGDNFSKLATSTSPATKWTLAATPAASYDDFSCAFGNGTFVVAGTNRQQTLTSTDALSWAKSTASFLSGRLLFVNGEFVTLVGSTAWTSTDGKAWQSTAIVANPGGWRDCETASGKVVCVNFSGAVLLGQ